MIPAFRMMRFHQPRFTPAASLPSAAVRLLLALGVALSLANLPARGQQALQSALSQDSFLAARSGSPSAPQVYMLRWGDFRFSAVPSLELDWNDNVTASSSRPSGDFILFPNLRITASYPLTDRNLLSLSAGIGYLDYFRHTELSTLYIQTGTGPSFDLFVKDFDINFHDFVSYVQDSSQQPLVAGTANYGSLNNVAGIRVSRPFGALTLTAGYDYQYVSSTSGQFQSQDLQRKPLPVARQLQCFPWPYRGRRVDRRFGIIQSSHFEQQRQLQRWSLRRLVA